jgi:HK97 family phage portal protein
MMFSWLFGKRAAEPEQVKAAPAADLILSSSDSGLPLSTSASFARAGEQVSAFKGWTFACVHAIASRCAGQAVRVGLQGRAGVVPRRARLVASPLLKSAPLPGVSPLESHPLLDLLNDPNDLQIAWSLWYTTVASLELTGRQLWYVPQRGDENGEPKIFPIPTPWLVGFNGSTRFESFRIRPPGQVEETLIPADEACYFFYPHPCDPRESASPLQAAALAVAADDEIQRSQLAGFKNGIFPRHLLVLGKQANADGTTPAPVTLTGNQKEQLLTAVRQHYAGAAKSGNPLIVGDGLIESVQKLSATPNEMDWGDSSKLTKERICEIFGVSPAILGAVGDVNRASSLAADLHMAATINPKLRLLGDTVTEWIARPRIDDALRVWFDRYEPRDEDLELKKFDLACRYGGPTLNEVRAFAGLPEVDWGDVPISVSSGIDDAIAGLVDQRFASIGAETVFSGKRVNGHNILTN